MFGMGSESFGGSGPGGYERTKKNDDAVIYKKTHGDGKTTEVAVHDIGGGKYKVLIEDVAGDSFGPFDDMDDALERAKTWMRNHPRGNELGMV